MIEADSVEHSAQLPLTSPSNLIFHQKCVRLKFGPIYHLVPSKKMRGISGSGSIMSLIISVIHMNSYIPNGVALVFSPRESFPLLATTTAATTTHSAGVNTR
jgi:hypothetical protein